MRVILTFGFAVVFMVGYFGVFDIPHRWATKQTEVDNYRLKSLALARKVRLLESKLTEQKYKNQALSARNNFLEMKMEDRKREIASVAPAAAKKDQVQFSTFNWSENKLLGFAEKAYIERNWERAAQFYNALLKEYPKTKLRTDSVLFKASVASFQSQNHFNWSKDYAQELIQTFPESKFYRGAKLWHALSSLSLGDKKTFMAAVEEFRMNYRNTKEWKVLSQYYEDLAIKFH